MIIIKNLAKIDFSMLPLCLIRPIIITKDVKKLFVLFYKPT